MTDDLKPKAPAIEEARVSQYLRNHPDFFTRHPDLLVELHLDHPSGKAVSLIERQVAVLRQRNTEMRHRLNDLLDNARDNDRLFERSKRLVLALLECNELGDLVDALHYSFDKEFGIDHTRLILFGETLPSCNARRLDIGEARRHLGRYLKNTRTLSGGLGREEIDFLFDQDAPHVGSAAMAVLSYGNPLGVLAIGNGDANHYHSSMGTLFLSHIAEVLNRLLPRYLNP